MQKDLFESYQPSQRTTLINVCALGGLALVAVAVGITAVYARYTIEASPTVVIRLDRLTGDVRRCLPMKQDAAFLRCSDVLSDREFIGSVR